MGLKEDFDAAADKVKNLKSKPSDQDLLELYGLFKQATVGDNNTEKPGMLDFKGKAKWEAWTGNKGMSSDDAMTKYVTKATALAESLGVN
ncbi:acyl-CoA-binding protein [Chironomus tepperi]|uniref:acyl-CoA-binding protein n=1 Tax=Chironomus tepperi TaxID=113505 RepID=UPI00391F88CC